MSRLVLLGPQRQAPILREVAKDFDVKGPCAVITAGWQEREAEIEELGADLDCETINLMLHQRGEAVFREDLEYRFVHKQHMSRVKSLQDLYRKRLNYYLDAVRDIMNYQKDVPSAVIDGELEDAFAAVRRLDDHHRARIAELHDEFREQHPVDKRPTLLNHYYELAEILERCQTVVVAGGHVAVLLNRLRLFNLEAHLREKLVIAWSAGAMCLGKQVVLFHDSPPQGSGYAETFEGGLGLFDGVLPLPDAEHRLQLDNAERVALFARRFDGVRCLTLGRGSRLEFDQGTISQTNNVHELLRDGSVKGVDAL